MSRYSNLFEPTFNVQKVLDKVGGATREETKAMLADYREYLIALETWENRTIQFTDSDDDYEIASTLPKKYRPRIEDEEITAEYGDKYSRSGVPKSIDDIIK